MEETTRKLLTFDADLELKGNLKVLGETVSENVSNLLVKDALIVANADGTDVLGTYVGTVYRISEEEAYAIAYDRTSQSVRLGKGVYDAEKNTFEYAEGEGLPVAIRDLDEDNDGQLLMWDDSIKAVVSAGKKLEELTPTIDKVIVNKNLTFTEVFGKYGASDTATNQALTNDGKYTLQTQGKSLLEVLENAFASDTNPVITQPTITFSGSNFGSKEVGTKVTPTYSFTNSTAGDYKYGPATNVTWKDYEATFNSVTKTGASGSFAEIQVTDGMSLQLTGKATHTAGSMPLTALGNNYPEGQIAETTKDYSYGTKLSGYRNMFVGTMTTKPATMTSDDIRALANKKASGAANDWSISIPAGTLRVIIALPSGRTLDKVLDVNNSNQNIKGSFSEWSGGVNVAGANGYEPKAYTVYYMDAASGLKANTFKVTIK